MADFLTVTEVAAVMRCHEWTVRKRIRDGLLPAVFEGGKFLISRTALNEHMAAKAYRPAGSTRRRRRSA